LPVVDGKGYLYLSGVSGNYASVPDPLGALGDFTMQVDGLDAGAVRPSADSVLLARYVQTGDRSYSWRVLPTGVVKLFYYTTDDTSRNVASTAVPADTVGIRVTRIGANFEFLVNTGNGFVSHTTVTGVSGDLYDSSANVNVGQDSNNNNRLTGKISRAVIWDNGTQAGDPVLDVDFTATNIRHGDTKFKCATGQTVTINQAGNDPATVIKKSVLRFDGADDGLSGLFADNIDGGYMFAAFSVLGGGDPSSRVFSVHKSGGFDDYGATGLIFSAQAGTSGGIMTYNNATLLTHDNLFDDANGDILHQVKALAGNISSRVNNADLKTSANTIPDVDSDNFNIGSQRFSNGDNAAIDLEYLALFPATITDAEAARVVNYINNRNNVFDLKDSLGHYFYDGAKSPVGNITDVATWNGRIVGSDNGDADKLAAQATSSAQPVGDGYKVTFADNTDFLTIPSTTQAGWQVVGTSLGTFAYRVNATAVIELNLLGNAGSHRSVGNSFGMLLLPESATGRDIEQARKLLIDRGAADGATASSYSLGWYQRFDITEFNAVDFTGATNFVNAWRNCYGLLSFNAPALPSATDVSLAWNYCIALTDFRTTEIPLCVNFSNAWQNCTALTSFPAGAKLGTAAENVNFTNAWQQSGLTSFSTTLPTAGDTRFAWKECTSLTSFSSELPQATNVSQSWYGCSSLSDFSTTDIKNCTNFSSAWQNCAALTSFPAGAKLGTAAENVDFNRAWQQSGITSFPSNIDLSTGSNFASAWQSCSALTSFPAGAKLGTAAETGVDFTSAWQSSGLTSFPALDLSNGNNFTAAFYTCTALESLATGLDMSQGVNFQGAFQDCSSLATIDSTIKLGTAATGVRFHTAFYNSGLTALPAGLDLSQGSNFESTFQSCGSLTTIGNGVLLGTASSGVNFTSAFNGCTNLTTLPANLNLSKGDDFQGAFQGCTSLVDFPAGAFDTMGTPLAYCFRFAWDGCPLSATSVFNILSSIDTSGQSGPTAPTTQANIYIDYDTGTGALSAATNTAVTSLKSKGWVVIVNGTTL
jgi:hypothetical protein